MNSKEKRPESIVIGSTRIKLSNIKEYGIAYYSEEKTETDYDSSGLVLVAAVVAVVFGLAHGANAVKKKITGKGWKIFEPKTEEEQRKEREKEQKEGNYIRACCTSKIFRKII